MPYFDDVTLSLSVGAGPAVEFDDHTLGARLEPDVTEEIRKYLGAIRTYTATPTWKLTLDYDQNWDAAAGLSAFLQTNTGAIAEAVIQSSTLLQQATMNVRIKPGPFGGTAGEIAEASVELTVDDQPVFAAFTPAAADTEASKKKAA